MGKFVDYSGVSKLWKDLKTYVASIAATKQDPLVSGTNIKTINGQSVLGSGDITLDLSLYKVVDSLPATGIDESKIYLVKSDETGDENVYTEYMYVNSAWEIIGQYKANIDLTPYAKTADVETALAEKADASDTYTKSEVDAKVTASGTFSEADATKLAGIESGAEVNVIETVKVDGTALAVSGKAVNIDLSGKVDVEDGKGLSTNDYTTDEKTKLAGIATGAEVNQNAFSNVAVGSTTIAADGKTDTLTLVAGSNITLTPDATNDKITIAATNTTYSEATSSAAGLMSAADYAKLAAIDASATADEALTDAEIEAAIAAAG